MQALVAVGEQDRVRLRRRTQRPAGSQAARHPGDAPYTARTASVPDGTSGASSKRLADRERSP
jgi:hypothetical protein